MWSLSLPAVPPRTRFAFESTEEMPPGFVHEPPMSGVCAVSAVPAVPVKVSDANAIC
jgi:hypothetical protein